ncbi:septum site-determining protein MinC [Planctobacterium marinum]|uniref:Probable septum site-determining protein MinC n=1 Tax=Planctobacterium marinum TaxID=1631968 RepID=A0AA48KVV4_9ALTE|nr:putative septum site-determining protein MinC [Planctobacterium marinum]
MSEQTVELKGTGFTLSVVKITSPDLIKVKHELASKIAQAPQFFNLAPVVINLETCENMPEFNALKSLLSELKLLPVGITGCPEPFKQAANDAGFALMTAAKKSAPTAPVQNVPQIVEKVIKVHESQPGKIVQQNLRSGQQIYAKGTDLIIVGSVSNGAEVIADGNIHIYGALRGRAIAGASGNNEARIFCRKLQAELVSINGHYWTSEKLQDHWEKNTCIALSGEQLHLTSLEA